MPTRHPVSIVVIGVDIGGTKITVGGVVVGPSGTAPRLVEVEQVPTPRVAPPAFYEALAAAIRRVQVSLAQRSLSPVPIIAVAHPGRFLPDGTLARGTTPNLGATPHQFDGLRPAEELQRRLGAAVVAENDAIAQMRFGVASLLRDPATRPHLLGETVVYIGPGTGMGGGVARVSPRGDVAIVTDGHLFDLRLAGCGDGTRTAEELFTGPAIARAIQEANTRSSPPIRPATAEEVDRLLLDPQAPPPLRAEAEWVADAHGEILAAIIATVHAGTITKVRLETTPDGRVVRHVDEPDCAWSAADHAAVRGARRFLLGGSVGCSAGLGARLRVRALAVLREQGLAEVDILQIPGRSADAGLLGIVHAIPLQKFDRVGEVG